MLVSLVGFFTEEKAAALQPVPGPAGTERRHPAAVPAQLGCHHQAPLQRGPGVAGLCLQVPASGGRTLPGPAHLGKAW